jgi:uncharacterized heparinase superfamily protein
VTPATAAHSTLTLADTSSCRFVPEGAAGGVVGSAILSGPERVGMTREVLREPDDPAIGVNCSHDGYLPGFGVLHRRRLLLGTDGASLVGEDRIDIVNASRAARGTDAYALRFHLHPTLAAELEEDGRSVLLTLPSGRQWRFDGGGLPVVIEESIFFATPDGARHSEQIVISSGFRTSPEINWSFRRLA